MYANRDDLDLGLPEEYGQLVYDLLSWSSFERRRWVNLVNGWRKECDIPLARAELAAWRVIRDERERRQQAG